MAFIEVPNCAVAALRQRLNGVPIVNTLWFRGGAPYTQAQCLALANALETWWVTWIQFNQVNTLAMDEIQVYAMDSVDAPTATNTVGMNGTNLGQSIANQAALLVTFRTEGRGRSSRGRNYWAGFPESLLTDNEFEGSVVNDMADAFANLNAAVGSVNGSEHVVISRYFNGAPRSVGLAQPVISWTAQGLPGTRRTRTGRS